MRKDFKHLFAFFYFLEALNTMARKKYKFLSYNDRKWLEAMYLNNERPADIAAKLGVHIATIYKELQRGNTGNFDKNWRSEYSAEVAQRTITESLKNRGCRAKLCER